MNGAASKALELWGIGAALIVLLLGITAWVIVHVTAAPGSTVRLLWGFATYQKKHAKPRRSKPERQVSVTHESTGTHWRLPGRLDRWLNSDLSQYGPEYIDDLIVGPHHADPGCMANLSYLDTSGTWGTQRIHRECLSCGAHILPRDVDNTRSIMKRIVLEHLQAAHLRGETVRSGMKI